MNDWSDSEIGEWIAEPPAPAATVGRGRPSSRAREEVLCHVWRLVYRQMQVSGDPNASRACRAVMRGTEYRDRVLTFTDSEGRFLQRVQTWELLRKWWIDAENLRKRSGEFTLIGQFVKATKRDVVALLAQRKRRVG